VIPLLPVIDHVVINVGARLNQAAEQYRRLGFQLTERGHHTLGTSNNLAMFGTDYLELLGFEEGNPVPRANIWQYPDGLCGLVFKPPADPALSDALNAAGIPAEPGREFSRPVNLPSGTQDARFRTVNLIDPLPNGRIFFCHHYTPELVWRDEWRQHANAATDIVEFTIATLDPARTSAPFARMFGPAALQPVEGGLLLPTDKAQIQLLTPDAVAARFGDAVPVQADGTDRMVALGLRTGSIAATLAALHAGTVPGLVQKTDRIIVPSASACELALSFIATS
jgi:hypothetical protein